MARSARFLLLLPALAGIALRAQAPAPLAAKPAEQPAAAPAANAAPTKIAGKQLAPRTISPEVAAQLAASRPKFAPVAPPPPPKPEEDLPDLRDIDKPKNTIIRLPKVVVQEQRPPVFTERELAPNPKALAAIAMRRYFTETDRALNRFRLPLFAVSGTPGLKANEDRALAMYYEDERLKNMADIADQTNMVMKSDATAGKAVQGAARDTFFRWQDFGWQSSGKK